MLPLMGGMTLAVLTPSFMKLIVGSPPITMRKLFYLSYFYLGISVVLLVISPLKSIFEDFHYSGNLIILAGIFLGYAQTKFGRYNKKYMNYDE